MHPGKHFYERRFPGAVIADKRHHLACMNVKFNILKRGHRAKLLSNAAKPQDKPALFRACCFTRHSQFLP